MSPESRPIREFAYPNRKKMCQAGQLAAAYLGNLILTEQLSPEELDTKANEIYCQTQSDKNPDPICTVMKIIVFLGKSGQLSNYIDKEGAFIFDGKKIKLSDVEDSFYIQALSKELQLRKQKQ
jgi:hypothetical protein